MPPLTPQRERAGLGMPSNGHQSAAAAAAFPSGTPTWHECCSSLAEHQRSAPTLPPLPNMIAVPPPRATSPSVTQPLLPHTSVVPPQLKDQIDSLEYTSGCAILTDSTVELGTNDPCIESGHLAFQEVSGLEAVIDFWTANMECYSNACGEALVNLDFSCHS